MTDRDRCCQRPAEIRRGLLITLATLLVAAGGFWAWQLWDKPRVPPATAGVQQVVFVRCTSCNQTTQLPADKFATLEVNEASAVKCPLCGKFGGQVSRKGGSIRPLSGPATLPPGGG